MTPDEEPYKDSFQRLELAWNTLGVSDTERAARLEFFNKASVAVLLMMLSGARGMGLYAYMPDSAKTGPKQLAEFLTAQIPASEPPDRLGILCHEALVSIIRDLRPTGERQHRNDMSVRISIENLFGAQLPALLQAAKLHRSTAAKFVHETVVQAIGDADLSPAQVAAILGVSITTVKRYYHRGYFPHAYMLNARVMRIPMRDVIQCRKDRQLMPE